MPDEVIGIGWLDGRLWLYLGETPVETGEILCWQDRHFRVRSGRSYCLGAQAVVCWAVLEEAKETADEGVDADLAGGH